MRETIESTLEIFDLATSVRRTVYQAREHFEAPNWSRDGGSLIINKGGRTYRVPVAGGSPERVETGFAINCNNDHGLSPDGTLLAISNSMNGSDSRIYLLASSGGEPRLVTANAPSYWHGWSPDGKRLSYCAERSGTFGIFTIAIDGGAEVRLTTARHLDDGPDYSPDGRYIYFNSDRTDLMKIWRMRSDGTEQTQMTFGTGRNDWFAHPSPDGKWLVFLSYEAGCRGIRQTRT